MHAYLTANITVVNTGGWWHYYRQYWSSVTRYSCDHSTWCSNQNEFGVLKFRHIKFTDRTHAIPYCPVTLALAIPSQQVNSTEYFSTNVVLVCYNWSTVPFNGTGVQRSRSALVVVHRCTLTKKVSTLRTIVPQDEHFIYSKHRTGPNHQNGLLLTTRHHPLGTTSVRNAHKNNWYYQVL